MFAISRSFSESPVLDAWPVFASATLVAFTSHTVMVLAASCGNEARSRLPTSRMAMVVGAFFVCVATKNLSSSIFIQNVATMVLTSSAALQRVRLIAGPLPMNWSSPLLRMGEIGQLAAITKVGLDVVLYFAEITSANVPAQAGLINGMIPVVMILFAGMQDSHLTSSKA